MGLFCAPLSWRQRNEKQVIPPKGLISFKLQVAVRQPFIKQSSLLPMNLNTALKNNVSLGVNRSK